jgi:hypothetical protein
MALQTADASRQYVIQMATSRHAIIVLQTADASGFGVKCSSAVLGQLSDRPPTRVGGFSPGLWLVQPVE